jgi:crotonobetainyl-CoA:carnitine CoA-transferase CaiB-like acyl-CoA transferase
VTTLLDGIRVLELAEGVGGPYLGSLLAAAGADVVKVEPPGGDRTRGWTPELGEGLSAPFLALNRNKRGACLDLASDPDLVPRLAARVDVAIVDRGSPGAAAFPYERAREANAGLVYCTISGFGAEGPLRDDVGGELPAQMLSEATSSLGVPGEAPVRLGTDVAGMYAGIYGLQAACAALISRDVSGEGQHVDVSLLGSLVAMRSTLWVAQSCPDEWWGFHLDSYTKEPWPGYHCRSGPVYVMVRGAAFSDGLVEELRMEWARDDPRFPLVLQEGCGPGTRHTDELTPLWERVFADFTLDELTEIVERYGGQVMAVTDYESLLRDEGARAARLVRQIDQPGLGPVDVVAPPWTSFDGAELEERRPAPRLGEHTAEVLRELEVAR